MPVRPNRLLPSVIVGALVTGALALGAGTASASPIGDLLGANECLDPETGATKPLVAGLLERTASGLCEVVQSVHPDPDSTGGGSVTPGSTTTTTTTRTTTTRATPDPAVAQRERERQQRLADERAAAQRLADQRAQQQAAQREAALAAQRAAQAQAVAPNGNLLAPASGAYGGLAATTPALGFGTFDPALLLAPAGSPLRTLTGVDQGSPVTTVSDVQAMAFDNLPGGLGMPAVTGTLILSAFAAFALRHRVLRRARTAADADTGSEADTAEIPAREPVG